MRQRGDTYSILGVYRAVDCTDRVGGEGGESEGYLRSDFHCELHAFNLYQLIAC